MGTPDSFETLRKLRELQNDDPKVRGRAILFLATMQHDPRVVEMMQYTADYDPDPRVRDLARQKMQQPAAAPVIDPVIDPTPVAPEQSAGQQAFWDQAAQQATQQPPAQQPLAPPPQPQRTRQQKQRRFQAKNTGPLWSCKFCGTEG
ncbi:MAG: HEAT repeat domain-containing protein, partial [Chloroflexi bacterium]|nr:HEAT repeat domain-containing protein [Chloroflexota bacterium]